LKSSDPELEFISGRLFDINLSVEYQYLYKYFTTARQRMFVKYFLTLQSYSKFSEHTGYSCSLARLKKLRERFLALEKAYQEAKEKDDSHTLSLLKSGQYDIIPQDKD
jgi:hypothetical protein